MALNDDAKKAAAEALSEYYEGDGWGYFGGAAEAAVAAAAPILLAEKDALVADLRSTVRLAGEVIRLNYKLHTPSPSTAGCYGGIGGQAFTAHCAEVCQHPRHLTDLERFDDLAREFLRAAERLGALRLAESAPEEPGRCKAHRDGECHWTGCPQVRDGEPRATGRHCPLDNRTAPEEES